MTELTLTTGQRLILVNQYKIMQMLSQSNEFDSVIIALENGYTDGYPSNVSDELSDDDRKFVMDVLDMYDRIGKPFPGFDGHTESHLIGYAQWLRSNNRFTYVTLEDKYMDAHQPMVDQYQRMLTE